MTYNYVKFNTNKNEYTPYGKENSMIRYVDKKSDHPVIIRKNIPKIIEKKIGILSSSRELFDKEKGKFTRKTKRRRMQKFNIRV